MKLAPSVLLFALCCAFSASAALLDPRVSAGHAILMPAGMVLAVLMMVLVATNRGRWWAAPLAIFAALVSWSAQGLALGLVVRALGWGPA